MLDNMEKRLKENGDKDEWAKVFSRQKSKATKEKVWVPKPLLVPVKMKDK